MQSERSAAESGQTTYGHVRDWLCRDILAGHLPPGSRLVVAALTERYGTSATPVRAALQELQGRGLVVIQPHQGARVRAIDASFIENVYELRGAVLGILLPRCVRFVSNEDLDGIGAYDAAYAAAAARRDVPAALAANKQFHHAVYALARNPEALDVMDRTWLLVDVLRMRLGVGKGRFQQSIRDHGRMLQALRDRDAPEAVRLFQASSKAAMRDLINLISA